MTRRSTSTTRPLGDHLDLPDLAGPLVPLVLDDNWHRATWQQRLLMVVASLLTGAIGGAILAAAWLFGDSVSWPVW